MNGICFMFVLASLSKMQGKSSSERTTDHRQGWREAQPRVTKCQTLCEDLNQLFTLKQLKIMKKKDYQKPTMNIVKLQHKTQLLQASGQVNATMNNEWEDVDI